MIVTVYDTTPPGETVDAAAVFEIVMIGTFDTTAVTEASTPPATVVATARALLVTIKPLVAALVCTST